MRTELADRIARCDCWDQQQTKEQPHVTSRPGLATLERLSAAARTGTLIGALYELAMGLRLEAREKICVEAPTC